MLIIFFEIWRKRKKEGNKKAEIWALRVSETDLRNQMEGV